MSEGIFKLRWRRNSNEKGALDGVDVSVIYVPSVNTQYIVMQDNDVVPSDSASYLPSGASTVNITVPEDFEIDVVIPNELA